MVKDSANGFPLASNHNNDGYNRLQSVCCGGSGALFFPFSFLGKIAFFPVCSFLDYAALRTKRVFPPSPSVQVHEPHDLGIWEMLCGEHIARLASEWSDLQKAL